MCSDYNIHCCFVYIFVNLWIFIGDSHRHSCLLGWQLFNAKWKSNANKILSGFCVIVNHNGAYRIVRVLMWHRISTGSCTNRLNNRFELTKSEHKSIRHCFHAIKMDVQWFLSLCQQKKPLTAYQSFAFFCLYIECECAGNICMFPKTQFQVAKCAFFHSNHEIRSLNCDWK